MVFAIGSKAAVGNDAGRGRRQGTHGRVARRAARRGHRAERGLLRSRRNSRHSGDARARSSKASASPAASPVKRRSCSRACRSSKCCRSCSRAKPDEPELRHVRVFTDAAGHARFATSSPQLGSQFASADVKILNDGVFPHLAATLAQRAGTNLLQGAYAPKSNWLAMLKPWRLAASLAAASAIAGAGAARRGVLAAAPRRRRARRRPSRSACQRVVGDSSTSGCQREVRQRLGASAGTATRGFLEHARGDRGGARRRKCASTR